MSGELEQAATGSGEPMGSAVSLSPVELATSLLAGFTPEQIRQLYQLHLSRGRDFGDGHDFAPEVQEQVHGSNDRARAFSGHPYYAKKRTLNIPRVEGRPFPLFPPRARGRIGDAVYVVVGVLDTIDYLPILCHPTDPLGEFDRPVPFTEMLETEQALGISGCRYSTLSYHRRFDPLLMDALVPSGGAIRYRTREFLRWVEARSLVPVVSF